MIGAVKMNRGSHRNLWRGLAAGLLCLLFVPGQAFAENSSASGNASSTDTTTETKAPRKATTRRTTARPVAESAPPALDCSTPAGLIACAHKAISTLPGVGPN
jgi:hypothetical protein